MSCQSVFRLSRSAIALAACLLSVSFGAAQDFTITKLPPDTAPVSVNTSGQVAGNTTSAAFFWTRGGGLQPLGDLGGGVTQARAMNDSAVIVGSSSLSDGRIHAFRWTSTGGMVDLGSPQGGDSIALFVNATGDVAGYSYPSAAPRDPHAFFWSASTGAIDLGVTGFNSQSFPDALNDSGEVVGYEYSNGSGFTAFRWTLAGGMETIGNFQVPFNSPPPMQLLNETGQVAGFDGSNAAAVWSPGDVLSEIGTLPPDQTSTGLFINQAGHVVGTSKFKFCCGKERTFLWTSQTGITDIGNLPKHPNSRNIPYGLNNRDQVVGMNGAAYFWSGDTGYRQVAGITFKLATQLSRAFNDAGQMLGFGPGYKNAVVASPAMHVVLSSSQNPSQAGQSVTFTASVSAVVGLPPDGELVTFKDGAKVLGTGPLSGGIATITTSTLGVKTHNISATYAGDVNYLPSKPVKLSQVVSP